MCNVLLCGNFHRFCNLHGYLKQESTTITTNFMSTNGSHTTTKKMVEKQVTLHINENRKTKIKEKTKLGQFILNNFPGFPLHKIHL